MLISPRTAKGPAPADELQSLSANGRPPYFHHGRLERAHARIAARPTPQKTIRIAYYLTAAIIVIGVSPSRLYLGTHLLTDMAAGVIAGLIWLATIVAGITTVGVVKGKG